MQCKCLSCNSRFQMEPQDVVAFCPVCGTTSNLREPQNNTNGICLFSKEAKKSAVGGGHYLVLLDNGLLFAWGNNDAGQLGVPGPKASIRPIRIMSNVIDVAAGAKHTIALLTDGTVLTWGKGKELQLGRGNEPGGCVPRKVRLPGKAVQVYAADNMSAALLENREVWVWGSSRALVFRAILPQLLTADALFVHMSQNGIAVLHSENCITGLRLVSEHHSHSGKRFDRKKVLYDRRITSIWIGEEWSDYFLDEEGRLFNASFVDDNKEITLENPNATDAKTLFSFKDAAFLLKVNGALLSSGSNYYYEANPHASHVHVYGRQKV